VDFGKLFAETDEQKFSLRGVESKKIFSHQRRNSIWSNLKVIYAGIQVSRKKEKEELSVICVEMMV